MKTPPLKVVLYKLGFLLLAGGITILSTAIVVYFSWQSRNERVRQTTTTTSEITEGTVP